MISLVGNVHRRDNMVTIKDVAEKAGVSISTVSNVLNQAKYVSPDLQKKVYEAVDELNYVRDSVASNMKRGYTKTIGVITSDICGLFYPYVVKGIYEIISKHGYSLTIYDSHVVKNEKGLQKEEESFRHLFSNRVDGVIFISNISKKKEKSYLSKLKKQACMLKPTPLVSLERDFSKYGIDSVFYDNKSTAKMAVEHLIDCGCRNIAFISGPAGEEVPEERKQGYLEAMEENGLSGKANEVMIEKGDYTHQSGYKAMKRILNRAWPIDGVYAANDQMAIGALKALKEQGIQVPEQIKLIGTDDVFATSIVEPPISTVHIKKKHMGRSAAKILLRRIEEIQSMEAGDTVQIVNEPIAEEMETRLVVRRSTDRRSGKEMEFVDW